MIYESHLLLAELVDIVAPVKPVPLQQAVVLIKSQLVSFSIDNSIRQYTREVLVEKYI